MLQKFRGDTVSIDSRGHKVMASIAQDADDFCSESFVEDFDHSLAVGAVAFGDRASFNVLARALAQRFDVSQKWFISHVCDSLILILGKHDIKGCREPEQAGVRNATNRDKKYT